MVIRIMQKFVVGFHTFIRMKILIFQAICESHLNAPRYLATILMLFLLMLLFLILADLFRHLFNSLGGGSDEWESTPVVGGGPGISMSVS